MQMFQFKTIDYMNMVKFCRELWQTGSVLSKPLFHDTSPIRIQLTVAWSARSRLFISPDRQTSDPKTSQWNVSTIQIPKHQVSDIFSRYTVIHYQAIFSDTDTKWHINIYIFISRIIKDTIRYMYI